ncbi:MAG TPA: hypothetical protein VHS31_01220 [Tepidisphaeraceae bacterium]|jgi:hypothetical protein|nr:hypothetical protein [Tepidisphaeraceae bacterium]
MSELSHDNSIDLICPECGYDLRGLVNERCPECGTAFDRATAIRSHIPWAQRNDIGSFRAYWRTVWLATIHIRRLSNEIARPISLRDAQRFRLITALLASLIPIVLTLFGLQVNGGFGRGLNDMISPSGSPPYGMLPPTADFTLPWMAGILLWPVTPLGILILLNLVSGVGSYWFHPGNIPYRQQNRAVALSHYACAPLVCASFPLLLTVSLMAIAEISWMENMRRSLVFLLAITVCDGLCISCIFIFWLNTLRLLKRTVGASGIRMTSAAVGLPIAWLFCAFISFGVLPWIIGFIFLMIDSMRH